MITAEASTVKLSPGFTLLMSWALYFEQATGFRPRGKVAYGGKLAAVIDGWMVNPYWASLQLDEKPADKS